MTPNEAIKQAVAKLDPIQRKELMEAFNEEKPKQIPIGDGRYLGVHIKDGTQDVVAGYWSIGKL